MTPTAALIQLAEAIRVELAAYDWPAALTVERKWAPTYTPDELTAPRIVVLPQDLEPHDETRSAWSADARIDVALVALAAPEQTDEIDGLLVALAAALEALPYELVEAKQKTPPSFTAPGAKQLSEGKLIAPFTTTWYLRGAAA